MKITSFLTSFFLEIILLTWMYTETVDAASSGKFYNKFT